MPGDTHHNLTYFVQTMDRNKTVLHIPESHSLHICPSSCGRKIAFRAYRNGQKANNSFMYIKEEDAVTGHYEVSIEGLVNTGRVVDMYNDESLFGFYGIQKLMHLIGRAYQSDDGTTGEA